MKRGIAKPPMQTALDLMLSNNEDFFKMRLDLQFLLIWGSSCPQITDGMKASATRSLTRNSALRAAAKCVPAHFLSREETGTSLSHLLLAS